MVPARSRRRGATHQPHSARHTCGTTLHLRGVPLSVVAAWLGHTDASVTARIYAHSQPDALKAASVRLGGL